MILGAGCLVIIASLCLHAVTRVDIQDRGLSSYAVIHGTNYEADILLRTDNINTPDWSRMAEACGDRHCVSYFKRCSYENGSLHCEYYYSLAGATQNSLVEITVANNADLLLTEASFEVLIESGSEYDRISLRKFVVNSLGEPPYCRERAQQITCWPRSTSPDQSR